jgi:hypothetical protein
LRTFWLRDATSQKLTNVYGTKILTRPLPHFVYSSIGYVTAGLKTVRLRATPVLTACISEGGARYIREGAQRGF